MPTPSTTHASVSFQFTVRQDKQSDRLKTFLHLYVISTSGSDRDKKKQAKLQGGSNFDKTCLDSLLAGNRFLHCHPDCSILLRKDKTEWLE